MNVKKDDHCLTSAQQREVDKSADLLLKKAGAYGRFPTPILDLIGAAELELAREHVLDKVFLGEIYRSLPNSLKLAPDRLKRAIDKVIGLLDRPARKIYIDPSVHKNKKPFLSLHEVAHDFLSWQRKTFDILEDGESELDEDTRDEFERQANCFASDVLFQRQAFTVQAADSPFGIMVPVKLSKDFGSSIYAAMRRYVTTSASSCAVIVFEKPPDVYPIAALDVRRAVASPIFEKHFGKNWHKDQYGPGEFFIEHLPFKRFSRAATFRMRDLNGDSRDCTAEAFNSTRQVFFLIRGASVPASQIISVSL
jgi:hypothetical protein